jgi:hypothetical protein
MWRQEIGIPGYRRRQQAALSLSGQADRLAHLIFKWALSSSSVTAYF